MRRAMLLGLAMAAAVAGAMPAAAQIVGRRDYGNVSRPSPFLSTSSTPSPSPRSEVRDLRERIDSAREAGLISRREARQLEREARLIGRLAARYGRDGLSEPKQRELATRAAAVRAGVNRAGR